MFSFKVAEVHLEFDARLGRLGWKILGCQGVDGPLLCSHRLLHSPLHFCIGAQELLNSCLLKFYLIKVK